MLVLKIWVFTLLILLVFVFDHLLLFECSDSLGLLPRIVGIFQKASEPLKPPAIIRFLDDHFSDFFLIDLQILWIGSRALPVAVLWGFAPIFTNGWGSFVVVGLLILRLWESLVVFFILELAMPPFNDGIPGSIAFEVAANQSPVCSAVLAYYPRQILIFFLRPLW